MGQTKFLQILKGSESFAKLRQKARQAQIRLAFEAQDTNINDFAKYLQLCALRRYLRKQKRIQKKSFSSETYV